jgi:hypothetical protein
MLLIYGVLLNVGGLLLIFSGAFWYCRDLTTQGLQPRPSVLKVALLGASFVHSATVFGCNLIAAFSSLKRVFFGFFPKFYDFAKGDCCVSRACCVSRGFSLTWIDS